MKVLFVTSGKGKNVPLDCSVFYKDSLKIDISVASHSNNSSGEKIARKNNLNFVKINPEKAEGLWEKDLVFTIQQLNPDIIYLLYNRIIPPSVLNSVTVPIINIHPSILPAFKGFKAVDQAISYGSLFTGITAHLVDEKLDGGKPIIQSIIPITNTVESYFDLEKSLSFHSVVITLQILRWIINEEIVLQKDDYKLLNPVFNISSFFPNIDVETELMAKKYFAQIG
jgi:phosphoribosylglycinamide formyltransferase-1